MPEPFMLVSLKEQQAKKLATVMSNETCTKLLNHLAHSKEGTESEIAKATKIPLSTVHYNLKQLVEAKLVVANEYHYSPKGREVLHYKLANKYIIIAPQEEKPGFLDSLRSILPALIITLGIGIIMTLLGITHSMADEAMPEVLVDGPEPQLYKAAEAPESAGAPRMMAISPENEDEVVADGAFESERVPWTPIGLAFIAGGCIALLAIIFTRQE